MLAESLTVFPLPRARRCIELAAAGGTLRGGDLCCTDPPSAGAAPGRFKDLEAPIGVAAALRGGRIPRENTHAPPVTG